jgi:hypothetical protein
MKRQEVYKLIDGERDYQEKLWNPDGDRLDDYNNPGDFLIYIKRYLDEAFRVNNPETPNATMDNVRKIAGLAVAAMEIFNAPSRGEVGTYRDSERVKEYNKNGVG